MRRPGIRCAVASAARGEPLVATASQVRRWVLVEQPGPWGPDGLLQSRLPRPVGEALFARAREADARVLLVRSPQGIDSGDRLRCFLASSGEHEGWVITLEVEEAAAVLDLDWSVLASPQAPDLGQPVAGPVHLVCTHGRHDPCCAEFGRPLVRALVAAGVPQVWESSHVGGDRFAANLVCLPHGAYFGRVTPEVGPALVADLADGRLRLQHYRGRSCFPPLVQAAEHFTRLRTGIDRLDGLVVRGVRRTGQNTVEVDFGLATGGSVRVQAERERAEVPVRLTCSAGRPLPPWTYRITAMVAEEGARLPG